MILFEIRGLQLYLVYSQATTMAQCFACNRQHLLVKQRCFDHRAFGPNSATSVAGIRLLG
jgi:hypothetical protein